MLILTGIFGGELWLTKVCDLIPLVDCNWTNGTFMGIFMNVQLNHLAVLFMATSTILTAKSNVISVFKHASKFKEGSYPIIATTGSIKTRMLEMIPFLFLIASAWGLTHHRLFLEYPKLVIFAVGLCWTQMVMRLILSEITKQCYYWQASLATQLPLVLIYAFELESLSSWNEKLFLILFVIYSLGHYLQMGYFFCSEMCSVLNMPHWWSIPKQKSKDIKGSE